MHSNPPTELILQREICGLTDENNIYLKGNFIDGATTISFLKFIYYSHVFLKGYANFLCQINYKSYSYKYFFEEKKDSTLYNIFSMVCMGILERGKEVPPTPKFLKMLRKYKGNTEI